MTRTALLFLTSFWLSITPATATLPDQPAGTGNVPLRIIERHILVDGVYIDGAGPFRFALDTGAQSSSIRTDVAARIGLKPSYRVETDSVGGQRYLPAKVVDEVTLGSHSASKVEMVIHGLDGMRMVDAEVQGVLGQNYLARFNYLLDLRNHRLSFEDGPDGQRIPFGRVADRMVVQASGMTLVLDSGASDLVLFRDRKDLRSTGAEVQVVAVTGGANVRMTSLPKLRVGDRILKNVHTAVIPQTNGGADGLLPLTLFDSVYVSNAGGYVVVR